MWALALPMEMGQPKDRKTLNSVGIEPATFGLDHRCSTDWAARREHPVGNEDVIVTARNMYVYKYKEGLRFYKR